MCDRVGVAIQWDLRLHSVLIPYVAIPRQCACSRRSGCDRVGVAIQWDLRFHSVLIPYVAIPCQSMCVCVCVCSMVGLLYRGHGIM